MLLIPGILLPAAAISGIFIYLGNRGGYENTRLLILRTFMLGAAYQVLALEVLSLFKAIHWIALATAWLLPGAGIWTHLLLRRTRGHPIPLPHLSAPPRGWEWLLLGILAFILIATFTVAWVTPPQTWDSLTYHLSRVAHWSQNQSVGHYISGIERQNSMGIGAELLVLNLYVLTRGDWLANFPQWLAMLGSLLGVSLAAGLLGAKPFGQLLAACFAATLPMGIVQASSTATDYLTTFWTLCTAVEVLHYHQQDKKESLFFASLAAGLALLTKPIAIPYILPFAVWMAVLLLKRHGWRTGVKWGAVAVMVVGTVNAGYLVRNLVTYGHVANPADLAYHTNQMRNLPGWVSILSRNAGLHAGLPEAHGWNENIFKVVLRTHMLLGLGLEDPETTLVGYFQVRPPSTQEDFASNPYHAYLILGLSILMLPLRKRIPVKLLLYAACVTLGFFLFSFMYKWQIFGARFHLLFFVLFAPAAGVVLSHLKFKPVGALIATSLMILSFPWLFSIDSRPLLPKDGQGPSILSVSREELYFSNASGVAQGIRAITADLRQQKCSQVGLMLHGDDPEYLFWSMLGAPRDTLRLEWIVAGTPSVRYSREGFHPCAIVCSGCTAEQASLRNLDRQYESSGFTVYMGR
jgi:hypothetical protein